MGDAPLPYEDSLQALIRAYIASELALEALPRLPQEVRDAVQAPIAELCRAVRPALEALQPGVTSHSL